VTVYQQSSNTFYVFRSSNGQVETQLLGQTTAAVPVSGDYDGDGKDDYAVKEGNVWLIKQSLNGYRRTFLWQEANDKPVQNDYDGDGIVDIAVWRESTGDWYIRQSSDLSTRFVHWGQPGDIPVPSYYNVSST